jgi:hypothetical protein
MAKRHATIYTTTLANASTQDFLAATVNDEWRVRHIKTLYVGISVSGVRVGLYVKGQLYSEVDTSRFGPAAPYIDVEFDVPPQITMHVGVTDLAGAARTNIPIVWEYEVDGPP